MITNSESFGLFHDGSLQETDKQKKENKTRTKTKTDSKGGK
jgi:hypothetical protein